MGSRDSGDGRFMGPSNIIVHNGMAYVVENSISNIYSKMGTKSNLDGEFQNPYGITYGGGMLFVAGYSNHRILNAVTHPTLYFHHQWHIMISHLRCSLPLW